MSQVVTWPAATRVFLPTTREAEKRDPGNEVGTKRPGWRHGIERLQDQRFSTLDTRFSRFSRHFLASFLKGVKGRSLHQSLGPFSLFKNSTLNGQRSAYLPFFSVYEFKQFLVATSWWKHRNIRGYESTTTGKQLVALPWIFVRTSKLSFSLHSGLQGKVCLRCIELPLVVNVSLKSRSCTLWNRLMYSFL